MIRLALVLLLLSALPAWAGAPTVLTYANALPGAAFANHTAGTSTVQSYWYPGGVQPQASGAVLGYSNALPAAAFANHTGSTSTVQTYINPGGVQPQVSAGVVNRHSTEPGFRGGSRQAR